MVDRFLDAVEFVLYLLAKVQQYVEYLCEEDPYA